MRGDRGGCRTASLGCIDCKKILIGTMNKGLEPIRARRSDLEQHPEAGPRRSSSTGAPRARAEAAATMAEVREASGLVVPPPGGEGR